ncbi:MAG: right-handed parallel beta-helix repeat-containing protein [Proteobacteria bacterium]|nr:right-handed parallel beta-helix repeat-containing protein [Pseudomonadota bacterium]
MSSGDAHRRSLLGLGAGVLATLPIAAAADTRPPTGRQTVSATAFGAKGDGAADDSAALQAAFDAAFAADGPGFVTLPPGTYKISRTLRIAPHGNLTRHHGILAHGARLRSAITDGSDVVAFDCRSTDRFLLIEGLDILGNGREGAGLALQCESKEHYLYNFCLRDLVIQGCGGDGARLLGDVFEGQIANSYFRDNRRNGVTFGHGKQAGILSALHVFGCVFGQNGRFGVEMVNGCYDVAYHGCYFLLNGRNGLAAANGCTLLSNCGFENNHEAAADFAGGGPGIWLQGFGTLIGCTGYSMFKQTRLIEAYVVDQFTMIGCSGSGDGNAKGAGLALIGGERKGRAAIISPSGAVEYKKGFEALEIGGKDGGVRFGSDWQSPNLARLGDHHLWVDRTGRLRLKKGSPRSDEDGAPVGS